jgi:cytochrome d ubiquinol oxidase subunit II
LTAINSAASGRSLEIALYWWPIGLLLAVAYIAFLFRLHRGKVQAAAGGEDY